MKFDFEISTVGCTLFQQCFDKHTIKPKTDHDFVFAGRNKWLGCDVTAYAKSGKFCLQKHPFFFAAYAVAETDRRESSIGLNTNNEGTDVDASYFSVYRSSAYGSKQSVSADSGYGTDGGVIQE